jgi:hypothetical protein
MNPKPPITMKSLFVIISVLAVLPVSAADPQPFAPTPFRLESPRLAPPVALDAPASVDGVRIDLAIGPIRIDYGIPVRSGVQSDAPRGYHFLDAPGPGYREQRARTNNQ